MLLAKVDAQRPRRRQHEVEDAKAQRQEHEDGYLAGNESSQEHAHRRHGQRRRAQCLAPHPDAVTATQAVGQITSGNISRHAHHKRHGHGIRQLRLVEAASQLHERGEPRKEEPRPEGIEEIHAAQQPELGRGDPPPTPPCREGSCYFFSCLSALSVTTPLPKGMGRGWGSPIPPIPHYGPDDTQGSQQVERHAPAHRHHDRDDDKRSQCAPQSRGCPHVALCLAHLVLLKPATDDSRGARRRARLAYAEHKPYDQQRHQSASHARKGRECRPPQHDGRQYLAMAEAVAQRTHRYLHQTVRQDESTLHPSPLCGRQAEVVHDGRPRHRDIDTVQKRHHAQNDEHDENHILLFHETPTFNLQC